MASGQPSSRRRSWSSLLLYGIASLPCLFLLALLLPLALPDLFISTTQAQQIQQFFDVQEQQLQGGKGGENGTLGDHAGAAVPIPSGGHQEHTDNWAVLIGASRFWFNYRHMSNTLGLYRVVKRLGIPDSQIILMLADDVACDSRNMFPGTVWSDAARDQDLYGSSVEVDYKGKEVTVENVVRLLTGRHPVGHPNRKRLMSTSTSNVLIYMTGHGGEDFLKFQDAEELGAWDLADAIAQMDEKKRYNELMVLVDTCQANSMYSKIYSPRVIGVGSSRVGQNSYSHHSDPDLGVALIDRFTHFLLSYLSDLDKTSDRRLSDLFAAFDPKKLLSDPGVRLDLWNGNEASGGGRSIEEVKVTDFFGGRRKGVKVMPPRKRPKKDAA